MKREPKVLLDKALDSLVLSIDQFNRPWDRGRAEAVLIFLDRSFELLLKAVIVHKGRQIRQKGARETFGFDKCVRKCLSDAKTKCLTEEQALTLQIINSLRDAAQHYVLDISEQQLYMHAQAGVTLFNDLLQAVFQGSLTDHLPERVLPVSSSPPRDLHGMIDAEFNDIKSLVSPGKRRGLDAHAKLRSLAIIESSLSGIRSQPSEDELKALVSQIQAERSWQEIFPGVASLRIDTQGAGLSVSIRLTKKEGEAVYLVPEGTPGATVVAVKRVNELDYYSMGLEQLANNLGVTRPKTLALIKHLNIQDSEDYFKIVRVGKSVFKRYSVNALRKVRDALPTLDIDTIWKEHRLRSQ